MTQEGPLELGDTRKLSYITGSCLFTASRKGTDPPHLQFIDLIIHVFSL